MHAYRVDQIDVVYPHEIDILQIYPGRDLITLVTCTPYAVNTHRLLVRGERIEYVEGMVDDINSIIDLSVRHLIVAGLLIFMLLVTIIKRISIEKKKRMNE